MGENETLHVILSSLLDDTQGGVAIICFEETQKGHGLANFRYQGYYPHSMHAQNFTWGECQEHHWKLENTESCHEGSSEKVNHKMAWYWHHLSYLE